MKIYLKVCFKILDILVNFFNIYKFNILLIVFSLIIKLIMESSWFDIGLISV